MPAAGKLWVIGCFLTRLFHIQAVDSGSIISVAHDGKWQSFSIIWNCTGWQSLVMLFISFIALNQFKGMFFKKVVIIITGIFWIYRVNISRITLELGIFHSGGLTPAYIFHDYLAKAYIILMFALFWFLTYKFVLNEKQENTSQLHLAGERSVKTRQTIRKLKDK